MTRARIVMGCGALGEMGQGQAVCDQVSPQLAAWLQQALMQASDKDATTWMQGELISPQRQRVVLYVGPAAHLPKQDVLPDYDKSVAMVLGAPLEGWAERVDEVKQKLCEAAQHKLRYAPEGAVVHPASAKEALQVHTPSP